MNGSVVQTLHVVRRDAHHKVQTVSPLSWLHKGRDIIQSLYINNDKVGEVDSSFTHRKRTHTNALIFSDPGVLANRTWREWWVEGASLATLEAHLF